MTAPDLQTPPWLCTTCGVEHPAGPRPPEHCPICLDDRQYVRPGGQRWARLDELAGSGRRATVEELEPGLHGITVEPAVGIGQRSLLVQGEQGNLLWDPVGYLDDELVDRVRALGRVAAIASSHPHMFGAQVAWSHAFGGAPVHVNARDAEWVQRPDAVVRPWQERLEPLPGVVLHRIGGHFPGSAVVHLTGRDGRGVLLGGDTVVATPDQRWTSFLRSYPNQVPLSAAVVTAIAQRLQHLAADRLYDNTGGVVAEDAGAWVQRSALRYVAWVSGEHDHLTGALD